jgi:tol-pal system protein YbgF
MKILFERGWLHSARALRGAPSVLVLALLSTGCLASKNDMRILQDEMRALRTSVARADSARKWQADSAARLIARANDSLRAFSSRFATFQGNVSGTMFEMGRQLVTIQELTGQSQKRVQELRASLEKNIETMNATPAAQGDTSRGAGGPGPAQLFQAAQEQAQRGSYGAARAAFQELLERYPNFDEAPRAQLNIAESFAAEKNVAAADSVYQLVASKYPKSSAAPTALYKYGVSLNAQKKTTAARGALNKLIKDYPSSDEVGLARDLLKTIR